MIPTSCNPGFATPEYASYTVKGPSTGTLKGPHVTTKVPDLVVLGMRKQVKNLKKAEKI
jgi:hypothetical protein